MSPQRGERRVVTVLLTDIVDSTPLGERLGPERSKILFDEVARLVEEQVERFDGTVAQHTGDGVLALFGAPVAHEDDSERAVRAALAVHDALAAYSRDVEEGYGVKLAARVGINTGPVALPEGDEPADVRYNALGDTVNVAARLQTYAGESGTAIGPATARQVEARFVLEPLGPLELKGRSEPVEAFRVAGEREAGVAAPARPLVGRDEEVAALEELFADLEDGRGAIVSIRGEPGIGKTRLVAELRSRHDASVRFLEGHASSYTETIPYWPVRDLFRGWLGLGVTAPETRVRLELKAGLASVLGERATASYPFLATLLGLTLEREAAERISDYAREAVQHQSVAAVVELVRALSAERPLCLVLDDLHWADEATLALLEELLPLTDEEALGVVLVHRSEREHRSWLLGERARQRFPHRLREVELKPLDAGASRLLAANAAEASLPDAAAVLLAERAGGNPFFLEEALRDLVERGALRRRNGDLELAVGTEALAVPTLVQEALQARLDRLEPATRRLIGVAAVIGRSFGMPLLEQVSDDHPLAPLLSTLQRLELIEDERRRPVAEYRFRHGLVQEAAYASLLEDDRRVLHGKVARALEELHADAPEEVYGLLAYHYANADETEPAVRYLLAAGDAARRLFAEEEAVAYYRRALTFLDRLPDDGRARNVLLRIGLTHHLAFDFARASAAYEEAFARAEAHDAGVPATERVEIGAYLGDRLDPSTVYEEHGWYLTRHLFRGLFRLEVDGAVVPDLAARFSIAPDGLSYRFELRRDATWSDGRPLTAADLLYAWDRTRAAGLLAFKLADVETVDMHDDHTFTVRLRRPSSTLPYVLAEPATFPVPLHVLEAEGEGWLEPGRFVGSGPFVFDENSDERCVLVRRPDAQSSRGNIATVVVSYPTDKKPVERWDAGEFDLIVGAPSSPVKPRESSIVETARGFTTVYLAFRADAPPCDDVRVRRALAHAVDHDRMAAHLSPLTVPARGGGLIPPSIPGHSHAVGLPHDASRARGLLAEAGYRGSRRLELTVLTPFDLHESLDEVCTHWQEVGVSAAVELVRLADLPEGLSAGNVMMLGWVADHPDPDAVVGSLLRQNPAWWYYRDAELGELVERAKALTNRDERLALYRRIEEIWLREQAAIVPLHYPRRVTLRRPWVEGAWSSAVEFPRCDELTIRR